VFPLDFQQQPFYVSFGFFAAVKIDAQILFP